MGTVCNQLEKYKIKNKIKSAKSFPVKFLNELPK